MPIMKFDLRIRDGATTSEIADALTKFNRELQWLLNGNLDAKNVKSMQFQGAVIEGTVRFDGDVTIKDGTPIGTLSVNESEAIDFTQLKADYNQLIQVLKQYNIIL
jgi:hypothetical protein